MWFEGQMVRDMMGQMCTALGYSAFIINVPHRLLGCNRAGDESPMPTALNKSEDGR